jgi:hypothetical protein
MNSHRSAAVAKSEVLGSCQTATGRGYDQAKTHREPVATRLAVAVLQFRLLPLCFTPDGSRSASRRFARRNVARMAIIGGAGVR